jgi:4-hydroxy-tetrahydrodipicolinate synthase
MTLDLRGALTALITPFRDGRVDLDRLREQVRRQIDGGIDGVVPVGTTGESPTLSVEEHKSVIEATVQEVAGRVPVVAGAGANNTQEAAELHAFAKSVGADAVLSVNPYYNKPTQEGLYRHFMTLCDRVDVPIVLYNIPGRTGVTMSPETVARLRRDGNIAAMKEATGDVGMVGRYRLVCDVPVLSGDDPLTLPMMAIGATGVISVVSNVLPGRVAELCRLASENDFAAAGKVHDALLPIGLSLFLDGNPAGVKHAMKTLGLDTGEIRLPLTAVTDETAARIEADLRASGV